MKKNTTFVSITPINEGKGIEVAYQFNVLSNKEPDGRRSCYVVGFDIFFAAPDDPKERERKVRAIMSMYMRHFFNDRKRGLKLFALELHKKGFKANNDMVTMKELVNNRAVAAKFKSLVPITPKFESEEESTFESSMAVAV